MDKYIKKLNHDVLDKFDFDKYGEALEKQDLQELTNALKILHDAFLEVYGTSCIDEDYEWILLPAIIQSTKNGLLTIGLVVLDLESSGEHWGTTFLTKQGTFDFDNEDSPEMKRTMREQWIPYKYYYTVDIPCDIHVSPEDYPPEIQQMLNTCKETYSELDFSNDERLDDSFEL